MMKNLQEAFQLKNNKIRSMKIDQPMILENASFLMPYTQTDPNPMKTDPLPDEKTQVRKTIRQQLKPPNT